MCELSHLQWKLASYSQLANIATASIAIHYDFQLQHTYCNRSGMYTFGRLCLSTCIQLTTQLAQLLDDTIASVATQSLILRRHITTLIKGAIAESHY